MPRQPPAPATALTRGASSSLTEQLAARFAERIGQRLLAPGERLPSVRECARRHGVSPSTVVGAYDLLQAQGHVQARPQRGYFVRDASSPGRRVARLQGDAPAPAEPPAAHRTVPVDATALIRGMLQADPDRPTPAAGTLPAQWLDAGLLQRALRRVSGAAAAQSWLGYGEPAGDAGLRQALTQRLADLGIAATPAQIVTTTGATQGLDLVARTLLRAGDAVLVDDPGWAIEFARLQQLGMRLLPVPRGPEGPDLAVLERLLRAHRPRLYVTVSVLHNPTGQSLGAAAAHRVLQLAEANDLIIVEDDTYGWLAPPHAVRLAQLDGLRRTIWVSGFSKVLVPQWRVGCIAAPPALVDRLVDTKLLASLTSPGPLEQGVAWCLEQGLLRRHAERIVARLDAARARTQRLALEAGFGFATPPQGLFAWVETGVDTDRLAQRLLDAGWAIAPGSLFHAVRRPSTLMRVNVAAGQDARFWRAMVQARGAPRTRGNS